jgi:hypothetical protein
VRRSDDPSQRLCRLACIGLYLEALRASEPIGSGDLFGTEAGFEGYRVSKLLGDNAGKLQKGKRLVLLGYGNFRAEHEKAHALMVRLKVDREYRDGPARRHDWHSGRVRQAVELLVAE